MTASHVAGVDRGESAHDRAVSPAGSAAELGAAWLDRDLSWLEFNRRVLQEALDERTPLLERVKFLAIFSSNLDGCFQKRIALSRRPPGDESPNAQERRDLFLMVRERVMAMLDQQAHCFSDV